MYRKLGSLSLLLSVLFFVGAGCLTIGGTDTTTSGPAGMFVSTDKGDSWSAISSMPTNQGTINLNDKSVYGLFEDPQDPQGLYWASREGGLFYSFDSGKSWKQSGEPLNVSMVRSVAIKPDDKCTIYATNGRQVFKTVDCVRSWTEAFIEIRPNDSITDISFDPFHLGDIYISESNGDVLKSTDGGANWSVLKHFPDYARNVVFDANDDGLMFVTTLKKGLFRSKDSGETWTDLSPKLKDYPGSLDFKRFLVYSSKEDEIYWISKYGVLTSRNAGEDWEPLKLVTPPGSVDIYGFTISRGNSKEIYYTGTIDNKSSFYRSVDGGATWETRKLPSKQIPTMLYAHPKNEGWIYLGFTIPPKK